MGMEGDALKRMWDAQAAQQRDLGLDPSTLAPLARREVNHELLLSLHEEVSELQRQTGAYKRHILAANGPPDPDNVADTIADTLKLVFAIAQLHGLDESLVQKAFMEKTRVVSARAAGERSKLAMSDVLCTDLDDVIVNLDAWRSELAEVQADLAPGGDLHAREEEWKDRWYRSGRFRDMPAVEGAAEALREIARWGWRIVIVTARPQWQYKRIHADTLEWLHRHDVPHDLILFGKDKVELVHHHLHPAWPVAFVEDYERNARALSAAGVPVLLYDQPHNRHLPKMPRVDRVHSWSEILGLLAMVRDLKGVDR
jgi:phosphoglycolate phosphatase-like HAD superfamily hydrolase